MSSGICRDPSPRTNASHRAADEETGLSFRFDANRLLTRTSCAAVASPPELDNKGLHARLPVVMGDVPLLLAAIQLVLFCSLSLADSFHAMSTD